MKNESGSLILDEEHLQRIRRIGKRLLNVANCLIIFGPSENKQQDSERSIAGIETLFVNSLPLSNAPEYIDDTRQDRFLSTHRNVVGAPYIRFYASYPIRNRINENALVGNVRLLDYAPRTLTDAERESLADVAGLVERELEMLSTDAARQDLLKKNWSLRRDSMIDPIAGTWNRVAIKRMLKQEMVQCIKDGKPLSLLITDLDGFKQINETHGSNIGDNLLLKVASRLRSCIRPHDYLGRYEDGKFMLILPGASHDIAKQVALRLQQAIKSHTETVGNKAVELSVSSGTVSTDRFASSNSDELISLAYTTLLSAQKLGYNSILQATPNSN